MGKKKKRNRQSGNKGNRTRGRRPPARKQGRSGGHGSEPDLLGEVRQRLREDHPFAMLAEASSLYSALDPRGRDPFEREPSSIPDRGELIESFLDIDRPETTALLLILAELTEDDLVRARIRRKLSTRSHALPAWLKSLEEVAPYRAVEMVHVLGDGDDVMFGVRLPAGKELTITVYIDHNLGRREGCLRRARAPGGSGRLYERTVRRRRRRRHLE